MINVYRGLTVFCTVPYCSPVARLAHLNVLQVGVAESVVVMEGGVGAVDGKTSP